MPAVKGKENFVLITGIIVLSNINNNKKASIQTFVSNFLNRKFT